MQFEVDVSKLKAEAEAILDIKRKLDIVRSSVEEIQDRMRISDRAEAHETCDRLRKQIERMDAVSARLDSLGRGLGKTAAVYKAYDLSAAEMTVENSWTIPTADKAGPEQIRMSSILNGIKNLPSAVPAVIDTKNSAAPETGPAAPVIRLTEERKEQ